MVSLASTSLPSSIEDYRTDEEIMLFIGGRKSGDPLPSNVITEVNPFSFDPWNAPDNMWYLCNLREPISPQGHREIRKTSCGYWKDMGCDLKILTSCNTVGWKVSWEFFGGTAFGNKSGWRIFEYKLEKEFVAADKTPEFNSLYRLFCHNKHMPVSEKPQNSVSLGGADGDYIQALLLSMLDQEEENIDFLEYTRGSQGSFGISNRSLGDSRPNHSAEFHEVCDFSAGDYLELNDLYDLGSSSSSDNSSCGSQCSDDYFDSEALLRDLDNEGKPDVAGHHTEHNFNISGSLRTNRVVFHPPPQSSMQNNGAVMEGVMSATLVPGSETQHMDSPSILPVNGNDDASGHHRDNQECDLHSQCARTSRGTVTNRVGKIAKLGKKYFCFASY